jgi:hypothetical protein
MKLPRLALVVLGIVFAGPATAAQLCSCIDGYTTSHSAVCTAYDCQPALMFAPPTPVTNARTGPRSRALMCDYGSCKLVCNASKR